MNALPNPALSPRAICATAPNQLYSWDIAYLPSAIRGQFFYLYLFMDIFGNYIFNSLFGNIKCLLIDFIYRQSYGINVKLQ